MQCSRICDYALFSLAWLMVMSHTYTCTYVGFANVCRQSTDFHFPGIDTQLQEVKEYGKLANQARKEKLSMLSPNSQRQNSRLSNSESPSHASDNGMYMYKCMRLPNKCMCLPTCSWN